MIPALPFLYLPDAITLILLLVSLGMLRGVAIDHMRQELLFIRKEMLLYWMNNGLNHHDRGYLALVNLIDSSITLTPKLSPGRLVFLYRLPRKASKKAIRLPWPDPSREVSLLIECTANANGREKLKRLQMELDLGLGTFFLMGSLSGWLLLLAIAPRILNRTAAQHSDNRIDYFFDMAERVLVRIGRRAQQIGYIK